MSRAEVRAVGGHGQAAGRAARLAAAGPPAARAVQRQHRLRRALHVHAQVQTTTSQNKTAFQLERNSKLNVILGLKPFRVGPKNFKIKRALIEFLGSEVRKITINNWTVVPCVYNTNAVFLCPQCIQQSIGESTSVAPLYTVVITQQQRRVTFLLLLVQLRVLAHALASTGNSINSIINSVYIAVWRWHHTRCSETLSLSLNNSRSNAQVRLNWRGVQTDTLRARNRCACGTPTMERSVSVYNHIGIDAFRLFY